MILQRGDDFQLEVTDTVDVSEATNPEYYDSVYRFGENGVVSSSHVSVTLTRQNERVRSVLLSATEGATTIHHASTCLLEPPETPQSIFFVAIGAFLVSLKMPSLKLDWAVQSDEITCFGIYYLPKYRCLISHGEMTVSRIGLDGTMAWQTAGADIFAGSCSVDESVVRIQDFNRQQYLISVATGSISKA